MSDDERGTPSTALRSSSPSTSVCPVLAHFPSWMMSDLQAMQTTSFDDADDESEAEHPKLGDKPRVSWSKPVARATTCLVHR